MSKSFSPQQRTPTERALARRYAVQIAVSMALYVVVLVLSLDALQHLALTGAVRILVAVAPAIPTFGVFAAVVAFMQQIDEMQRQIHLEAFALSAGLTALCGVTYGFLQNAGLPCIEGWWIFVAVDIFWALSLPFVRRRYE